VLTRVAFDLCGRYLIHAPFFAQSKQHLQDAWKKMNRCLQRGLARHIGVSSFTVPHLQAILELCGPNEGADVELVKPALNQVELHPLLPQPDLLAFMRKQGIALEGFASLMPLTFKPSSPHEQEAKDRMVKCVGSLASKHGAKEASSVLLHYAIDQGAVIVTTSSKRTRLETYLDEGQAFTLSVEEVAELEAAAGEVRIRGFFEEQIDQVEKAGRLYNDST
jgi:diketogulonate reductase-like aldo/keto reductase